MNVARHQSKAPPQPIQLIARQEIKAVEDLEAPYMNGAKKNTCASYYYFPPVSFSLYSAVHLLYTIYIYLTGHSGSRGGHCVCMHGGNLCPRGLYGTSALDHLAGKPRRRRIRHSLSETEAPAHLPIQTKKNLRMLCTWE